MSQGLHLDRGIVDAPYDPEPLRAAAARKAVQPRHRSEAAIVADVIDYIQALSEGHARKVHGSAMGQRGEPDIDACVGGRAVKLEGKTVRNRPTVQQHEALKRWQDSGALAGWFCSVQDALDLLDHVGEADYRAGLEYPGCRCSRHWNGA